MQNDFFLNPHSKWSLNITTNNYWQITFYWNVYLLSSILYNEIIILNVGNQDLFVVIPANNFPFPSSLAPRNNDGHISPIFSLNVFLCMAKKLSPVFSRTSTHKHVITIKVITVIYFLIYVFVAFFPFRYLIPENSMALSVVAWQ